MGFSWKDSGVSCVAEAATAVKTSLLMRRDLCIGSNQTRTDEFHLFTNPAISNGMTIFKELTANKT